MSKELKRILCVDDETDILEVVKMCLETLANLEVTTCLGGAEALEKVAAINPDLILMDVMMPGMNGPMTLKQLKLIPEVSSIPVVFMTARVQPSDIEDYLNLGATAVIQKPFDPMKLPTQLTEIFKSLI